MGIVGMYYADALLSSRRCRPCFRSAVTALLVLSCCREFGSAVVQFEDEGLVARSASWKRALWEECWLSAI